MIFVKVGDKQFPASISGRKVDPTWDGRESKTLVLEMAHAEAAEIFVDGAEWSIVCQDESYLNENGETVTPDPVEHDNSEFCVAGDIVDHRNGTVSVKLGKLTEVEEKEKELSETEAALDEAYEIIYGGV